MSDQKINFLWECMERRLYKAGSLVSAQSKRSYINFDYNAYFVPKTKKKQKKIAKQGENKDENMESHFIKALTKLGTNRSITISKLESIDQKSLDVHASNIDTPRNYSDSVNSFDEPWEGLFIISKGSWEIRNRKDNYSVGHLVKGNYFGESEILKIIDATYFGDIYASQHQDLEVLFLSYEAMKRIRFEVSFK